MSAPVMAPTTLSAPVAIVEPLFDVWAYVGAAKGGQSGWSMIAQAVTFTVAMTYKNTCLYKISFQQYKEPS